eukprot:9893608-Alexandrium_andersonii.AAC.1
MPPRLLSGLPAGWFSGLWCAAARPSGRHGARRRGADEDGCALRGCSSGCCVVCFLRCPAGL